MWIDAMHPGLLADILENPDDDTPRLILADWLEEQGQEERAEFIRVQCKLATIPLSACDGYYCDVEVGHIDCTRTRFELQEHDLLNTMLDTSTGNQHASTRADVLWAMREGFGRHVHVWGRTWSRGFIESVTLPCQDWLKHGPELVRQQPIRRVRLSDREPEFFSEAEGWGWCSALANGRSHLPIPLIEELAAFIGTLGRTALRRPWSKQEAEDVLSHVCLLWAKQQEPALCG